MGLPTPAALEPTTEHVQVVLGGVVIADTRAALRILETSHPPTYYLPVADFAAASLRRGRHARTASGRGRRTST